MSHGYISGGMMRFVRVPFVPALVLNGFTVPMPLLAAPGAGLTYDLISIYTGIIYAGTPYATNTYLNILFTGATLTVATANNILLSTASRQGTVSRTALTAAASTQYLENTALVAQVATGNPTNAGVGGTLVFLISYAVIPYL
jgi:hypothetical protein